MLHFLLITKAIRVYLRLKYKPLFSFNRIHNKIITYARLYTLMKNKRRKKGKTGLDEK